MVGLRIHGFVQNEFMGVIGSQKVTSDKGLRKLWIHYNLAAENISLFRIYEMQVYKCFKVLALNNVSRSHHNRNHPVKT